jgi:signal transduction histidine kinase
MSRRLLLSYLSLTVIVLAVLEVPLGVTYSRNERRALETKVERDAVTVASLSEGALERSGEAPRASLQAIARRYQSDTGGRVVVVGRRGNAVADSNPIPGDANFADRPEIAAALRGRVASGVRHSDTLGLDLLYVAVPVASAGRILGAARITYPTSAVDRRVTRYWLTLAAIAGIVLAGVSLLGLWVARGVARPLRKLEQAAVEFGSGRLDVRAPEEGPEDVRRLAREFNETAAKLERLLESQHAFVADASHELRTPLTALRLRLENMDAREAAPALAEVERLSRLVESLLALARADAVAVRSEPVDVDAVLEERLVHWQGVERRGDRGLRVSSSPDRLGQILDNLVANALAVSDDVGISVNCDNGWVELHVVDHGPGLSAEERVRAFGRFWRGPGSEAGGSGLGLAIVSRLADADGGEAELRPAPGGGIDAVVRLRPV